MRDMYDWASSISRPYIQTLKAAADPALGKMSPVLDSGFLRLDQFGCKKTIGDQTESLAETVDGAAGKFLEILAEKYPLLMEPTEDLWGQIKVRI